MYCFVEGGGYEDVVEFAGASGICRVWEGSMPMFMDIQKAALRSEEFDAFA